VSSKKFWFEDWFNSPYYHLLYGNRDQHEAGRFISNLLNHLNPNPKDSFLDLACGKGRHALEIASKGYHTTGIDLSENSISEAQKIDNPLLNFVVGDMRHAHFPNQFNFILNLFTSFGYFETAEGQSMTLNAIHEQLKDDGLLVIDYLNVDKAAIEISNHPDRNVKIETVNFETRKRVTNQFISKEIIVEDKTNTYTYFEHLWRLQLSDFEKLLSKSGFTIQTIFGDYELNKFSTLTSDRLIIVAQK
jgi:SAM-dependent methyltransferase